jgi:hypothetical protein
MQDKPEQNQEQNEAKSVESLDLTTVKDVKHLMSSSNSSDMWNEHCDMVKRANGGYPEWWYEEIIVGGVYANTQIQYGWSAE